MSVHKAMAFTQRCTTLENYTGHFLCKDLQQQRNIIVFLNRLRHYAGLLV